MSEDTVNKTKAIIDEAARKRESKEAETAGENKAPVTTVEDMDVKGATAAYINQSDTPTRDAAPRVETVEAGENDVKVELRPFTDEDDPDAVRQQVTEKRISPRTREEMNRGREAIDRRYTSDNSKAAKKAEDGKASKASKKSKD